MPTSSCYDNGQIKFRGEHLDGEMHGEWEFFCRDGSKMRSRAGAAEVGGGRPDAPSRCGYSFGSSFNAVELMQ